MNTIITSPITNDIISNAYSYSRFNKLTEELWEQGEVTNHDNSESNLNYTKLNLQRTHRWDKRGQILPEVKTIVDAIERPQTWLTITEGWCGDSAQILPFINKMAELNPNVTLKVILRDEHPEIIDQFLTDGKSRSIPKVVILDTETLEVLGNWGPRPVEMQKTFLSEKADPEVGPKEASKNLHTFYAKDKGTASQKEFAIELSKIGPT